MYKIVMGILLATAVTHASNNGSSVKLSDWSGTCLTAEEEKSRKVVLAIRAERDRLQKEKQQLEATIRALQQELQNAQKPNK